MSDKMSIRFDSSAYVLLKIIPGKIWFVFAEFIDNSISSYIQNRKELEKLNGPNFKLTIELSYSKGEDKITITDNASGIDEKNWKRALEPGNIPENNKGGNEFGMGMKFSAVWLCNKWKLESKNINESFERSVNWNYQNIINNKLEDLPFNKNYNPKSYICPATVAKKSEDRVCNGCRKCWSFTSIENPVIYAVHKAN